MNKNMTAHNGLLWTAYSRLLMYWIFFVLHRNLALSESIHFSSSCILPPYVVVATVWKTSVYIHRSNLIHCEEKNTSKIILVLALT